MERHSAETMNLLRTKLIQAVYYHLAEDFYTINELAGCDLHAYLIFHAIKYLSFMKCKINLIGKLLAIIEKTFKIWQFFHYISKNIH